MQNVQPLLLWVKENGEVKSLDRLLVKMMLHLVKHKIALTVREIESSTQPIMVPDEVVPHFMKAAEAIVQKPLPNFT